MIPEQLTLDVLRRYAPVLSLNSIFTMAGLNPSSLRSRLRRGRPEIKREEAIAIIEVLSEYGIYLNLPPQKPGENAAGKLQGNAVKKE